MRNFYLLIVNSLVTNIINMTVWFAITFFIYLQSKSVLATSILSGIYLVFVALTGFWFGSLVDHNKKKKVMLIATVISFIVFTLGFIIYINIDLNLFKDITNPVLWFFIIFLMVGALVGNIRGIALPTLVTLLVPEEERDSIWSRILNCFCNQRFLSRPLRFVPRSTPGITSQPSVYNPPLDNRCS